MTDLDPFEEPLFAPGASQDLDETFLFYLERNEGAARRYLNLIRTRLLGLRQMPTAGQRLPQEGLRQVLLRRYHQRIIYSVEARRIVVWALIDTRMDPAEIEQRIAERLEEGLGTDEDSYPSM